MKDAENEPSEQVKNSGRLMKTYKNEAFKILKVLGPEAALSSDGLVTIFFG